MAEDVDTCRICSMPAEDDRPLFYPCKCSGTIKYIHQDCLTTWLEHSKKKSCDVCKHQYAFTNVYAQDMPQRLPVHLVAKRVIRQLAIAVLVFMRAALVSLVWLALVPYVTVLTWRTYFWVGTRLAWYINDRPKPPAPEQLPLDAIAWLANLTTFLLDADADPSDLRVSRDVAQELVRSVSGDVFTGQIISSMIVLVFLCAFLLREWIVQHARPGMFEEPPVPPDAAGDAVGAPNVAVAPAPVLIAAPAPPVPDLPEQLQLQPQPPTTPILGPRPLPVEDLGPIFAEATEPAASPSSTMKSDSGPDNNSFDAAVASSSRVYRPSTGSPHFSSYPNGEFFPPNSRKGKMGSFDASRQAWLALKAKQRGAAERSASVSTVASSSSSLSLDDFDWPPLQDTPITPLILNSPDMPLPSFRSASTGTIPSSSVAPHSAATTTSPVVDDEPVQVQIPPFTPSAFQFVVDPGPSTPSTLADSPSPSRRTNMSVQTGEGSMFSGDFPRSGSGSSPGYEFGAPSPLAPFTPSALSSGDEHSRSPFAPSWDRVSALSPAGPSSMVDNSPQLIPPFTPSLFTFQGSTSEPAAELVPQSATDPAFAFTFAQDMPNSSPNGFKRRPGLAPAAPSEEIPIALYKPPEDYEVALEEHGRRWRRPRLADDVEEVDHYFAEAPAQPAQEIQDEEADEEAAEPPMPEDATDTESDLDDMWRAPDDGDDHDDEWVDADPVGEPLDQMRDGGAQDVQGREEAPAPVEVNVDEDFDGILEAVGMRGHLIIIFQNAAVAAILLDVAIAIGVWAPYTIGKIIGLLTLNPRHALTLLNMPVRLVRLVTDPIVDGCISLVKTFILPTLLAVPRFFSVIIVAMWLVASQFYIQVADFTSRLVTSDASSLPTLQEREMAFRARDAIIKQMLLPNLGAVTSQIANFTVRWTSVLHSTVTTEVSTPSAPANVSDWALELLHKLPLNHTTTGQYVHSLRNLSEHGAIHWVALVENDGVAERALAISLGYIVFLLAAACYLNMFSSANARTAGRAARNAVVQQLVVLKVAVFIFIELFMFPIGCGILLDLCTLRILPNASLQSRIIFFGHAPLTSIFIHWLIGTTFMYQFAILLSVCRSIMRPGAMWFVKDPQDPAAHPIRDIIDRPAMVQLKKLSVSVVMYSIVIVCGIGLVVAAFLALCPDLFPLRWNLREPISELPVDLLFAHFVPSSTFKYLRLKTKAREFMEHWWRFMAHQLRLTSLMHGERCPSEEYTPTNWSWRHPFNVGTGQAPDMASRDGSFLRVPATDSVVLPKNRSVTVRTDADGNPMTVEGATIIAAQNAEAEEEKRDPKLDYTVVYIPPHHRWRIAAFILLFWLTSAVVVLFGISLPLRVGRAILALFTDRELHDLYAFTVGSYALVGGWFLGTELPTTAKPWTLVRRFLVWAPQATYMVLTVGVILPTLLAMVIELYLTLPIRMMLFPTTEPIIRVAHCWAAGLVMGRIVLFANRLPRAERNAEEEIIPRGVMHAWHAIERNGLLAPDVVMTTRDFIVPVGGCLVAAIVIPALVFAGIQKVVPVPVPAKLLSEVVYLMIFGLAWMSIVVNAVAENAASWMQGVRDQEFLVERRLRNLEARK